MRKVKWLLMFLSIMVICCGLMVSTANAALVKKIVFFKDGVTTAQRFSFAVNWVPYGAFTIMDLPSMNGTVMAVPDTVRATDLAYDSRVASVQDDVKGMLPAVSAAGDGGAGDGGAGDGGATSFITPAPKPPTNMRPWGVLNLYDQPYNPLSPNDLYNGGNVAQIIKDGLTETKRVKIAILDTGIDINHPWIRDFIKGGIDLVNFWPGIPMDENGHGSHVAGTLSSKYLGATTAPQLYAVKVLSKDATGDLSTLIMGLQWAINNGMHIVNMSLAFAADNPALRLAVQKAQQAGIVLVAATGNHSNWITAAGDGGAGDGGAGDGGASGTGTTANPYPVMYPAKYPEVIAVGAMDSFEEMAPFSNTGPEMDVLAPGTGVLATYINGGFGICSGTSMATPHASATAAMMLGLAYKQKKVLTPVEIKTIIKETAENGKINLIGALGRVQIHK